MALPFNYAGSSVGRRYRRPVIPGVLPPPVQQATTAGPPLDEQPAVDPLVAAAAHTAPNLPPAIRRPVPEAVIAEPVATPAPTPNLADIEAPPVMVVNDRSGRPQRAIGGTGAAERNASLIEATERFEPKPESKWKHRLRLLGLLGTTIGGALSHNPNAVAASVYGLGRNIANPKTPDEDWQDKRLNELRREADQEAVRDRYSAQTESLRATADAKSDAGVAKALDQYNKLEKFDPDDPQYAGLKQYFESRGLTGLPKRDKYHKPDVRMVGGRLVITAGGESSIAKDKETGEAITDPSKTPNQSVKIGDVVYDHLTPHEAAILAGRAYEGTENRASREGIAAENIKSREKIVGEQQAGANKRAAMKGSSGGSKGGALNPTLRGAIVAISKFRGLTTKIAQAEAAGDHQTAQALTDERNGHERTMRQVYGDVLLNDDKGKPTVLNDAYTNPPSESGDSDTAPQTVDLTGQTRSVSAWRKKYRNATPEQEAAWKAKVQAAGGTIVK